MYYLFTSKSVTRHISIFQTFVPDRYTLRVCEGRTMNLRCPAGYSVRINAAVYGRLLPTSQVCPKRGIRTTRCRAANSLAIVKGICHQSRSACSVAASNGVFGDPCAGTHKYLEVTYHCSKESEYHSFFKSLIVIIYLTLFNYIICG